MRRVSLILFCLLFQSILLAQVSEADYQKIAKILGENVVEYDTVTHYPYTDYCTGCAYVPSLTFYRDTTGVVYNSEYVLFRDPIAYTIGNECGKWVSSDYVTVKEYTEFQAYVRDSIAREKLFYAMEDDNKALEFLIVDVDKVDIHGHKGPYYGNRELDRQNYPLNWNKKFSFNEPQYVPFLADMYLPVLQRYNAQRIIDERKLIYRYTDFYDQAIESDFYKEDFYQYVENWRPTLSNTYLWSKFSLHDRDIWNVQGQLYNLLNLNEKAIGISGIQANAFCHWKQEQLQKEFTRNGLKYRVIVSLPLKEDIIKMNPPKPLFTIPEHDYTDQWQISVGEYLEFVKSVQDSILYELLYQKIPNNDDKLQLLKKEDMYFDEARLEYHELDASKWENNRERFNLKYSKKIARKYKGLWVEITSSDSYRLPVFSYCSNNAYERSIIGELVPEDGWVEGSPKGSLYLVLKKQNFSGEPIGMDFILDFYNVLGHSSGVRTHEDLSRFYEIQQVDISPSNVSGDLNDLINGLTYEQAIAFYYWKYPIQYAKGGEDLQRYVLPSKEQFEKIQKGESVKNSAQSIEYPTPVFRHVVHVFPLSK